MSELKPCPFCGGNKVGICETEFVPSREPVFAVSCRTRNCHGAIFQLGYGLFLTREEATAAWNRRTARGDDND